MLEKSNLIAPCFRTCRKNMLIFKHTILLITLGCRPHITSFCDLWVIIAKSSNFTHKAETAVWAAPSVLNQIDTFLDTLFSMVRYK